MWRRAEPRQDDTLTTPPVSLLGGANSDTAQAVSKPDAPTLCGSDQLDAPVEGVTFALDWSKEFGPTLVK